jgi:hypothetical protein
MKVNGHLLNAKPPRKKKNKKTHKSKRETMHGQRVVFSLEKPMLSMTKPSRTTLAH